MPSSSGIKSIITKTGSNPHEIGDAVRRATQDYSALMRLANLRRLEEMIRNEEQQEDAECFFDLLDAYIQTDPRKRQSRLGELAENYQMNPSELEDVLKYLNLDL